MLIDLKKKRFLALNLLSKGMNFLSSKNIDILIDQNYSEVHYAPGMHAQ